MHSRLKAICARPACVRRTTRRALLTQAGQVLALLAAAGLLPEQVRAQVAAYNQQAFNAKTLAGVLQALGASAPTESSEVHISGPDVAENGAAVPIHVATTLTGVQRLLLAVEKNPSTLSAVFELSAAVDAEISTRLKMDQTSRVFAVAVLTDGRVLFASKHIQVIVGGCSL